jgi:biopolymer transport protein ExbD
MRLWSHRFEPRKARIELVPMIDTMAFLLVFFMIASLAMTHQRGITVALPNAKSAQRDTWADRSLVITESKNGVIHVNKELVTKSQLQETLTSRLSASPDQVIVINADESLRHREVVWLMDIARLAGAKHMAIATTGKTTPVTTTGK